MRRSKLELYTDILQAIVVSGPLKVSWLTLKAKANYVQLKPVLTFLLKKAFVEETKLRDGSAAFGATELGRNVLAKLKQVDQHNELKLHQSISSTEAFLLVS